MLVCNFLFYRIAELCSLPWVSLVRTAELWCNSVSGFLRIAELCDLPCSPLSKLQNCAEFRPLYPSSWAEGSKSCFWSLALKPHVSLTFSLANWSVWAPGAPWGFWGVPGPLWAAWVAWGCLRLSWGSLGALLGPAWCTPGPLSFKFLSSSSLSLPLSLSLSSSLSGGPEVVGRVGGSGSVGCWSGFGGWGSLG